MNVNVYVYIGAFPFRLGRRKTFLDLNLTTRFLFSPATLTYGLLFFSLLKLDKRILFFHLTCKPPFRSSGISSLLLTMLGSSGCAPHYLQLVVYHNSRNGKCLDKQDGDKDLAQLDRLLN